MIAPVGNRTRRWGMPLLLALALLSPGCSSRWALRTVQPGFALQWPYQPNRAKVTYVGTLTGFAQHRGAGAAVKSALTGAPKEDPGALVLPVAVATGSDGRIAVADRGRRCAHLFIPAQQIYLKLDGTKEEKISSPVGVIFDSRLRLFLSDSTGKVFAFGPGGEFLFTLGKAGMEELRRPTGLAYSPARDLLYVVDTLANRVHAFSPSGQFAFSFGQRGEGPGRFNFPTHIFRSASGELYITNSLEFRVEIYDEAGKFLAAFGHHGDGSGDLAMPKGLAVDRDGVVYVVDSLFDNIQLFNRGGDFLLTLGRRGVDFGEFWLPSGIFINERDEMYVCDTYNRRVQIFRITERYAENAS